MGDLLQPWHLMVLFAIFSLIVVPLRVLPFWFIRKKAGFTPWLSLLYLVPLGAWFSTSCWPLGNGMWFRHRNWGGNSRRLIRHSAEPSPTASGERVGC